MFLRGDEPFTGYADGFLYERLIKGFQSFQWQHAPAILGFLLVFVQAMMLNNLSNRFKLMQRPNYLTGMSYLLISSLFSEWFVLSSAMLANTFFIWIIYSLTGINYSRHVKTSIFNTGIILGIAVFFYYPAILFLLLILAGLVFYRPFRLPEWLMAVVGFLTPFYFLASVLFLTNHLEFPSLPKITFLMPAPAHAPWAIASLGLILITSLAGAYFVNQNLRRQIVHTRKNWLLIYLYCVVSAAVPFINNSRAFNYWILCVVPFSLLAAAAFLYPEKRWFRIVIHWAMFIVALVTGYYFG